MTKAAAIYQFWNSFGIPSYEENSVPEDAELPYITYQLATDSFDGEVSTYGNIWYYSGKWTDINAKTEEISQFIGRGGKILRCDGGRIWIKRGQPFAQNMGDENDDQIRRKYVNLTIEFFTSD